ncbi:uncharacterized protein METZ01_LOCUS318193, partial [marine metagenome]
MREHAEDAHTKKGLDMFLRPSSGSLKVWNFTLKDDETDKTYDGLEQTQSLRGADCTVSAARWMDWALNEEPPWIVPAKPANGPMESLLLVPSFIYQEYIPKDETEYYRFGMPEPVTIHLSNVWVREKQIESASPIKTKGKLCILWKGEPENLVKLADLLAEYDYIDSPSVWLDHFSTDPLKRTDAPPIKWGKYKYQLKHLLRHLQNFEIRESHSS